MAIRKWMMQPADPLQTERQQTDPYLHDDLFVLVHLPHLRPRHQLWPWASTTTCSLQANPDAWDSVPLPNRHQSDRWETLSGRYLEELTTEMTAESIFKSIAWTHIERVDHLYFIKRFIEIASSLSTNLNERGSAKDQLFQAYTWEIWGPREYHPPESGDQNERKDGAKSSKSSLSKLSPDLVYCR